MEPRKLFFLLLTLFLIFQGTCQSDDYFIVQMTKVPKNMVNEGSVLSQEQVLALLNDNFKQFLQMSLVSVKVSIQPPRQDSLNLPSNSNPPQNTNINNIQNTNRQASPPTSIPKKTTQLQKVVTKDPGLDANINDQRLFLLYKLNELRQQNGAKPVSIDEDLNRLAQLHSNDMQRRGFFSHKNPEGEMPSDRARRLGLSERVAENLAKTSSLIQAHVGLANSPGHFKNSVNKEYERVGFGIAIDRRGLILTVILGPRDLNKNPLTSNEKSSFNTGLVNTILSKNPNLTRKGENTKLSRDVSNWMKTDRRQNIFTYLRRFGHGGAMSMRSVTFPFSDSLLEDVQSNSAFMNRDPRYSSLGLGMAEKQGKIELIVVYN